jgi:arylsulfatase A-like enzyme
MTLFCFLFAALPFCLRLYSEKKISFLSLGEDLFIGAQEVFLLSFAPNLFFIPLSLLQIYFIGDAFLYKKMGFHIHPSHFTFFKTPRPFLRSAVSMGILRWIFFSLLVVAAYAVILRSTFSKGSPLPLLLFLPLLFCYKGRNALFSLEVYLIPKKHTSFSIQELPTPKGEIFTRPAPKKYPLLKLTEGFTGPSEFTITAKKPNIVFLFLESFRMANVGPQITPKFEVLAKEGILFDQFYANGIITMDALWSTLIGIPPVFSKPVKNELWMENRFRNIHQIPLITLADILKKEGYYNLFLDGSDLSLENHGRFLKNHGFHEVLGKEELSTNYPHEAFGYWGMHDEYLLDIATKKMSEHKDAPLFTMIFTISNHDPWTVPPHYSLNTFEEVQDPIYRKFLQTMHYTDDCLDSFISRLENSLVFILGDHGIRFSKEKGGRTLSEEGVRVPLLIYGKNMIKEPKIISEPASQIDLLPTVMDILGIKGLNHSLGTSLLRKNPDRLIVFTEPAYLGTACGIRKGEHKLLLKNSEDPNPKLFDLLKDPKELFPLEDIYGYQTIVKSVINSIGSLFIEKRFTYDALENLVFSSPKTCNDKELKKRLNQSSKFFSIDVSHCTKISDVGFKAISKKGLSLHTFQGEGCLISDKGLKALIQGSPALEVLDLPYCHLLSDMGLETIARDLRHLKSINLSYNTEITGEHLPAQKTQWCIAEFAGCHNITDKGLQNIAQIAPNLKTLTLSCTRLTDEGISRALEKLPHLMTLKLFHLEHLTDRSLSNIKSASINHLTLQGAKQFTDAFLQDLQKQPLYHLELLDAPKISSQGLSHITATPLIHFILTGPELSDDAIATLKKLPLKTLTLSPCIHFSKKGLEELIDSNLNLLILKECNPSLKEHLTKFIQSENIPKKPFISF